MGAVRVVITSPLSGENVAAIAAADPRLDVVYPDELIPAPAYPSAHPLPTLDVPDAEQRWVELLESAEILFDFGPLAMADRLPAWPRLRWIQATSAGVGQLAKRAGLTQRRDIVVTTASGVHARPLAEFAVLAMLVFGKDVLRYQAEQRARVWRRHAGEEMAGKVAAVVGAGRIGREVARLLRALDVHVIGVVRTLRERAAADVNADEVAAIDDLDAILPRVDAVVLATPHTPDTEGLLDARRIALLPERAIVVNIARGDVVDEAALADALAAGRLRGAALDVFTTEPPPDTSPFWDLPNVLVSPHSASTVADENDRIVEIFCENLRAYLAGRPLRNVLDPDLLY
ncbi:MAG TPA: D-2-hydroxyacid dehydrogenase [Gaiellales bacterium]|nr:D-2-hydroxyacid dehydrogenase [Gaiellales bacterium]